jgi:hypothetical protein
MAYYALVSVHQALGCEATPLHIAAQHCTNPLVEPLSTSHTMCTNGGGGGAWYTKGGAGLVAILICFEGCLTTAVIFIKAGSLRPGEVWMATLPWPHSSTSNATYTQSPLEIGLVPSLILASF